MMRNKYSQMLEDLKSFNVELSDKQLEQFDKAIEKELGIMINGGNDYAVKDADFITNMTLHGNQYAIIDAFVPFYQIALHGYVNYAGNPINLSFEKDQLILESAEAGAGLNFSFMEASPERLQETYYTEYYASNFDTWKERFVDIYKEYNSKNIKIIELFIHSRKKAEHL